MMHTSFEECLQSVFASYLMFNEAYPEETKMTWDFVQQALGNFAPEAKRGSKVTRSASVKLQKLIQNMLVPI